MASKIYPSCAAAVADIPAGATIAVGGFVAVGSPSNLIRAIHARGVGDLTLLCNEGGFVDLTSLLYEDRRVRKLIASYPYHPSPAQMSACERQVREGTLELELVPIGTFAERLRIAGAGLGGFYTAAGVGTLVAEGKEVREFDGREYLFERPLRAEFACIRAHQADPYGNLVYRKTARNYNALMAQAADVTIVEVEEIVPLGALDPEAIHTPGIFVDRIVQAPAERKHIHLFDAARKAAAEQGQ